MQVIKFSYNEILRITELLLGCNAIPVINYLNFFIKFSYFEDHVNQGLDNIGLTV